MAIDDAFRTEPIERPGEALPVVRSSLKRWGLDPAFTCYSERPVFVDTHWTNGRSEMCSVPVTGDCSACRDGRPIRTVAYVGAYLIGRNMRCLVEVTERVANEMISMIETKGAGLTGLTMKLSRLGNSPKGMLLWEVADTDRRLPRSEPVDVIAALKILFRVNERFAPKLPAGDAYADNMPATDAGSNRVQHFYGEANGQHLGEAA